MSSFDEFSRRDFLRFMGQAAVVSALPLEAWAHGSGSTIPRLTLSSTLPSSKDELLLHEKLSYSLLIQQGDKINANESFGSDNDFTAFLPLNRKEALLWVNHETPNHVNLFHAPTRDMEKEMLAVGGSIIKIRNEGKGWKFMAHDPLNRRLTGLTKIPFSRKTKIKGQDFAIGTLANCAGGVTPWGTILTCEENYHQYYGDRDSKGKIFSQSVYGWETRNAFPPEHYGWVVEVNPQSGQAKKLVSLGRYCREGATTTLTRDGRCVVYSGDDAKDQCLYKFISSKKGSLDDGELFVTDIKQGKWIPLDWNRDARIKAVLSSPLDVLIYTREAAHAVGGTPLARPEGIAIDQSKATIYISLTGDAEGEERYGSILKLEEKGADPAAHEFKASTFLMGGPGTGFAAPDNIVLGPDGNLWLCTDLQEASAQFKNNGLFVIPLKGPQAGRAIQVASAPKEAELTGPSFSADGKTLFLSVQHPGYASHSTKVPTSHWPQGNDKVSLSAVVAITGIEAFS